MGEKGFYKSKVATVAMLYVVILHSRHVRVCAIQNTALANRFHADNQIYFRSTESLRCPLAIGWCPSS